MENYTEYIVLVSVSLVWITSLCNAPPPASLGVASGQERITVCEQNALIMTSSQPEARNLVSFNYSLQVNPKASVSILSIFQRFRRKTRRNFEIVFEDIV